MLIIICFCIVCIWLYHFFCAKNRFTALTYITGGIVLPLFLYLLRWSNLITETPSGWFMYIMVCFSTVTILYTILTWRIKPNRVSENNHIVMTSFGRKAVPLLTILYIILYLVENYMGSGLLFPGLKHVDIHTYSAPIVSYFTNCQYLILAINYFAFKATKSKVNIGNIVLIILLPIVSRSARMQMAMCCIQFISLVLFFESSTIHTIKEKKDYKKVKRIVYIGTIVGGASLIAYTNYRMNHYGVYNLSYADTIGYDGPANFTWLAPYYGYFPISFNNLNINLTGQVVSHNYIGLFSFACFYFGILQLDNLLGISTTQSTAGRLITSTSATVPTGFWDYYYDFGWLCFIPIIVAFAVCYRIVKKASKERIRVTYRALYFWYIPMWFFMSFQNVLFSSTVIITAILMTIVMNRSYLIKDIVREG